jgi:peptidylamidoglycolate lyase
MLTNETQNNILVYNKDGQLIVNSWGTTYPGAHGLTLSDENGEEFLYLTDTVRHQVIKTTLKGDGVNGTGLSTR